MSNASEAAAPRAIGSTPSGARPSAVEERQDTHPDERQDIAQLGMWIFIASEVLFFGGLLVAYLYGRSHWPDGFAAASRRTDVVLGSINTALLLTSSAVAAVAVAAADADRRSWVARCLWITAALGCVFLAIKGMEWHAEWKEGLFPGRGFIMDAVTPVAGAASGVVGQVSSAGGRSVAAATSTPPGAQLFFVLYFVMTGLHAVHMIVGIGVIGVMAWRAPKDAAELEMLSQRLQRGSKSHRASSPEQADDGEEDLADKRFDKRAGANLRVEMAALYWHFVDIVWIFLYPLLYLVERHS